MPRLAAVCALFLAIGLGAVLVAEGQPLEHRVLSANDPSGLEETLNEVGGDGFRFVGKLELEAGVLTSPVGIVVAKTLGSGRSYHYRVIEAGSTTALEHELQDAGEGGFDYRGQVSFKGLFDDGRVAIVLEQVVPLAGEVSTEQHWYEYRLLPGDSADSLQRELARVAADGFVFVDGVIGASLFGARQSFGLARRVVRE